MKSKDSKKVESVGGYGAADFGVDFQRHVLSVILRAPRVALRFRDVLDPAYFTSNDLSLIAEVGLQLIDKYRECPSRPVLMDAVKKRLGDPVKFEAMRDRVNKTYASKIADAETVTDKIVQFGKRQALVNAVLDAAGDIRTNKLENVLPKIQKAISVGSDLADTGIVYRDVSRNERREWYNQRANVVPTGLEHLDQAMNGGPRRGELMVVYGQPKAGKTTTLINISHGVVTNPNAFNTLYVTCELHKDYVGVRFDHRVAGSALRFQAIDPKKYRRLLEKKIRSSMKGELVIRGFRTKVLQPERLDTIIDEYAADGLRFDAVVVDYADILKPPSRASRDEAWDRNAAIYEDLRAIAQKHNAVLWTASRTKATAADKDELGFEDAAGSYEKGSITDGAIGLMQSREEKLNGIFRFNVIGLRNAESGKIIEGTIDRARCYMTTTAITESKANEHPRRKSRPDKRVPEKSKPTDAELLA